MLLAGLGLGSATVPVSAQAIDCEALRQQMATALQPDPNREARFDRSIQQQRTELARTEAYGDQIGCGGLNLFGAPPQCDAIETRITRMRGNLDSLEQQARTMRNGDPDQMGDLAARYDRSCRTPQDDTAAVYADPGLVDRDGNPNITTEGGGTRPQGGSKAVCVRTCDGGFFPLGSSVRNDDLDALQSLCSAQCPNTEAKLYTTSDTDDIAAAVALDGSPYTALPAAFKFQKSHEDSCTCKPPGQSWVQALAKAEEMLEKTDPHDVIVTEKMSAEMARPTQPVPAAAPPRKSGKRKTGGPVVPPPALPETALLGAIAAQAPTAGGDAAGIAAVPNDDAPVVAAGQGSVKTILGPDGVRRRVRTIAPGL